MGNACAYGRDQLILVFGKWPKLEPKRLQFLPADFVQSNTERGQLWQRVIRDEVFSMFPNFGEHDGFGFDRSDPRLRPLLDRPFQILKQCATARAESPR